MAQFHGFKFSVINICVLIGALFFSNWVKAIESNLASGGASQSSGRHGHTPGSSLSPTARDLYADSNIGGGTDYTQGPAYRYHYQMFPNTEMSHHSYGGTDGQHYGLRDGSSGGSYGVPSTSYGEGWDDDMRYGNDGNGAIGLLGLLGLKGLKGLIPSLLKLSLPLSLLFFPLSLPLLFLLLLPLILLIAAPLVLLIFFLPVPVVTVPQNGRLARDIREMALSQDCLERISCEVTRVAKQYGFNPSWVADYLEKSSMSDIKWLDRVTNGIKSGDCQKFTCSAGSNNSPVLKPTKLESI